MTTTHRGGCLCGEIRYEVEAEPMFGGQCQCLHCQHVSGGGHSSFMAFPAEAVKVTGTPSFHEVVGDSGNPVRRGFCPTCGSPLFGHPSAVPHVTTINVGSLDDPSVFEPGFVVYASRGQAWDLVDPALPSFPKLPPMAGGAPDQPPPGI